MQIVNVSMKIFELISTIDPAVYEVTLLSLFVSGTATLIAALWGIPMAAILGLKNFRGKFLAKGFFNALMSMPTVALGLILYFIFTKTPLNSLTILYTPTAIIIGEAILITPIIISFTTTAIEAVDPQIMTLAKTLGASEQQAFIVVLKEALNGIFLAVIASFNRAIAELGIALMVGGNIVLTTRIANETNRGNIALSITLTIILLIVVFGINLVVNIFQRRRK